MAGGDKGVLSGDACKQKKVRMIAAIKASTCDRQVKDKAIKAINKMTTMKIQPSNFSAYRTAKKNFKANKPIPIDQVLMCWAHAENLKLINKIAQDGGDEFRATTLATLSQNVQQSTQNVDFSTLPKVDADDSHAIEDEDVENESSEPEDEDPHKFYKSLTTARKLVDDANLLHAEREELHRILAKLSSKYAKIAEENEEYEHRQKNADRMWGAVTEDKDSFLVSQNLALAAQVLELKEKVRTSERQNVEILDSNEQERQRFLVSIQSQKNIIEKLLIFGRMNAQQLEVANTYMAIMKQNDLDVRKAQHAQYLEYSLDETRKDVRDLAGKLAQAEETIARQKDENEKLTLVRTRKNGNVQVRDIVSELWFQNPKDMERIQQLNAEKQTLALSRADRLVGDVERRTAPVAAENAENVEDVQQPTSQTATAGKDNGEGSSTDHPLTIADPEDDEDDEDDVDDVDLAVFNQSPEPQDDGAATALDAQPAAGAKPRKRQLEEEDDELPAPLHPNKKRGGQRRRGGQRK